MSSVKYSVIIPTAFDHLEKDLQPCIEAILKYTDLSDVEVIVVSNGCTDDTDIYVNGLIELFGDKFKLLTYPEALGYPKAVNKGIDIAQGDYVIFLNNDAILLEQPKNQWLNYLVEPFILDSKTGVTGTRKNYHTEAGREFIVFFCAMTTAELAKKIRLNEEYGIGTCDDVEFCIEVENLGYKLVTVPVGHPPLVTHPGQIVPASTFPLYHLGGSTMYSLRSNDYRKNALSIAKKYNPKFYEKMIRPKVLAFVPTKDRYDSLALTLQSIALQTIVPDALWIYDDGECKDLRSDPIFKYIFSLLTSKGIDWKVVFGHKKGQHYGHQLANKSEYPLVWRLDDDEVAEPDVLERLLKYMSDASVGAVGGAVFIPGEKQSGGSNRMEDIFHKPNLQWCPDQGIHDSYYQGVSHLYSSFLYRTNIADYNLALSPKAHREETLFTNALKQAGYGLIVDTSIKTYHFRRDTGGIRSGSSSSDAFLFANDENIFKEYLNKLGIGVICLNVGLGDTYAFLNVLPDLQKKYKHLILGVCYGEVFNNISNITLVPVQAVERIANTDVYRWCGERKWKGHFIDGLRAMLGVVNE